MSRESMTATMTGRHPSLAGIGQFTRGHDPVFFEIGWPEFERDSAWARRLLDIWKIANGDHVLVTGRNCEGPWLGPVFEALRQAGIIYGTAEPYSWDVRRSVTMLHLLPVKAIVGLSDESADALLADADAVRLLADVPVIWARPKAVSALRSAGVECAAMAMLGPALAAECPARDGLHFDPEEWRFAESSTGLVLTVVGNRLYHREQIELGVHGGVVETPCGCGLAGARIRLA
ncbi:hypothetical protein [Nocardia barduliensis]|uniref:hypothetical protein n=1 Tax=Nocardia barduliensis TaxID=2736643 RepID=UPI0015744AB3|nr:hypothetical protein [Nocardia barduliensis]